MKKLFLKLKRRIVVWCAKINNPIYRNDSIRMIKRKQRRSMAKAIRLINQLNFNFESARTAIENFQKAITDLSIKIQ